MIRTTVCAMLLLMLVACEPVSAAPDGPSATAAGPTLSGLAGRPFVVGALSVSGVWIRGPAAPGGAVAAYMLINNSGPADNLSSVTSDAAQSIQLYQTTEKNGAVEMVPVPGIAIPQDGQALLKPGGNHAMLTNLTRQLKVSDKLTLILTFDQAGILPVVAEVQQ